METLQSYSTSLRHDYILRDGKYIHEKIEKLGLSIATIVYHCVLVWSLLLTIDFSWAKKTISSIHLYRGVSSGISPHYVYYLL